MEVIDKIREAKTIVIVSPVYWHNLSGLLRCFLDRTYGPFQPGEFRGRDLYAVVQGEAPEKWMLETCEYTLTRFAKICGFDYKGMATNIKEARNSLSLRMVLSLRIEQNVSTESSPSAVDKRMTTLRVSSIRARKRQNPCFHRGFVPSNIHQYYSLFWWEKLDLNQRSLAATDLQSAPFDQTQAFSRIWWDLLGSDQRRADLQPAALPTELRSHGVRGRI